jgi:hypothetical protein
MTIIAYAHIEFSPDGTAIIEEGLRQVAAIQASLPPSSIRMKLKAQGLLP